MPDQGFVWLICTVKAAGHKWCTVHTFFLNPSQGLSGGPFEQNILLVLVQPNRLIWLYTKDNHPYELRYNFYFSVRFPYGLRYSFYISVMFAICNVIFPMSETDFLSLIILLLKDVLIKSLYNGQMI